MLSIDLKGKVAFIAGVGDDQGFGWAIAKAFAEAGAIVLAGTWTPMLKIFQHSLETGKFDESRKLNDGSLFSFSKIYPLDAVYDRLEDVPEDVKSNKRYADQQKYTISEVSEQVAKDFGKIDILVHSLANAPEIKKPLLETTRNGYLTSLSSSSYSLISLLQHFGPNMNEGSSVLTLTYIAGTKVVPGYGGGMSSAKAALENDVRTLAWEAGRKWGIRVNAISAGPMRSRAAKAIGIIDKMINYSLANAPIQKHIEAEHIANTAAFLSSDLSSAISGTIVYVDQGLHAMAVGNDSPCIQNDD